MDCSRVAKFDDLCRQNSMILNDSCKFEISVLNWLQENEINRKSWLSAVREAKRLQTELDTSLKTLTTLETKLYHARRMLELESKAKKDAETQYNILEKKLNSVRDTLQNDNTIRDELKQKIAFIHNPDRKRLSYKIHENNEINSTGSFLSDLSLTQSEDDVIDVKSPKNWKKHRPTVPLSCGTFVGGKKRRSSDLDLSVNGNGPAEPLKKLPLVIESEITVTPKMMDILSRNLGISQANTPHINSPQMPSPIQNRHVFFSKTFLGSDTCIGCPKKIRFGSLALKCKVCRSCAHSACRDKVKTICVPPNSKNQEPKNIYSTSLIDYIPKERPYIPALLVYCVNEIEGRSMSEVGLYRVSGSDRDIKVLREKFNDPHSTPSLTQIDAHVLCGCVKDFLRSLQEPIIPTDMWSDFAQAAQEAPEKRSKTLFQVVKRLPEPNCDVLCFVLLHFQRIASCPDIKMPIGNLAKVFGPTLVGFSSANMAQDLMYKEIIIQCTILEELLKLPTELWSKLLQQNINIPSEMYTGTPTMKLMYTASKRRKYYGTPPYQTSEK